MPQLVPRHRAVGNDIRADLVCVCVDLTPSLPFFVSLLYSVSRAGWVFIWISWVSVPEPSVAPAGPGQDTFIGVRRVLINNAVSLSRHFELSRCAFFIWSKLVHVHFQCNHDVSLALASSTRGLHHRYRESAPVFCCFLFFTDIYIISKRLHTFYILTRVLKRGARFAFF